MEESLGEGSGTETEESLSDGDVLPSGEALIEVWSMLSVLHRTGKPRQGWLICIDRRANLNNVCILRTPR